VIDPLPLLLLSARYAMLRSSNFSFNVSFIPLPWFSHIKWIGGEEGQEEIFSSNTSRVGNANEGAR